MDFSPRGCAITLRFGLSCLFGDLYGAYDNEGEEGDVPLRRFLSVLCSTHYKSIDLMDEMCICLGG